MNGSGNSSSVVLRNKRMSDAPDDFAWQQDPELSGLDATDPVNCTYREYLADYTADVHYPSPNRRMFAIDTRDGEHIGNCVYYNIDDGNSQAELGIMIGNRDYWSQGYGTTAMKELIGYVFRRTGFNRLYLKTLKTNLRAQNCFSKSGLTPCGFLEKNDYHFLLMDISRRDWQSTPV